MTSPAPLPPVLEELATTHVERKELFKITLCGSTRFRAEYELWNKRLTLAGFLVYSVSGFGHSGDTFTDEEKARLDQIHLAKIDNSHAIVVVGDGYVGASTRREIEHALANGKAVYATSGGGLDLPDALSRRVAYVYNLRTGPDGPSSLRYRAFDYEAADTRAPDPALLEQVKEGERAKEALRDAYSTLWAAFVRIHALPRSSDTELANRIGHTRAQIERVLSASPPITRAGEPACRNLAQPALSQPQEDSHG